MNLPIDQIILGDAIESLKSLPDNSIDALISDPPYATTNLKWDKAVDWAAFWVEADRVCKPNATVCLFAQQPFATDLIVSNRKAFRYEIVWEKLMATGFLDCNKRPMRCHELILVFCRQIQKGGQMVATYNPQKTAGKPYSRERSDSRCQHYGRPLAKSTANTGDRFPRDVLKFSSVNKGFFESTATPGARADAVHPTQKPIDLLKWLTSTYSNPGDVILDPFLGSGTTAIAALESGRHYIGVEKSEEYHAIALDRIARTQGAKIAA